MKATGIVRRLDELGRIVVPIHFVSLRGAFKYIIENYSTGILFECEVGETL